MKNLCKVNDFIPYKLHAVFYFGVIMSDFNKAELRSRRLGP